MTLARFVKWSSLCLVIGVVAVVAGSYVITRDQGRLPPSHPWPAITLLGSSVMMGLLGFAKQSRTSLVARLVAILLLGMGAVFYMWSVI